MAGVTDLGWVTKTKDEIVEEFQEEALEQFGAEFPTTPDSVAGQMFQIIAAAIKNTWDLGQTVTDYTGNRSTSSGIYLDYLADLIGLTRITDSGSTGNLLFIGTNYTTISESTTCKDDQDRYVLTDEEHTLDRTGCYNSTFSVLNVVDSTEYTITIEGVTYSYISDTDATEEEIITGLVNEFEESEFTIESTDTTLTISYPSYLNSLTSTNSSNINLDSVGGLVEATAQTTGDLSFPADTITKLVTSVLDIDSVTNPEDFEEGRDEETDTELRQRMDERTSNTGTATVEAIQASLSDITGVTQVLIKENTTMEEDDTGIPAKSIECFVVGGADSDIGETIWSTKPAGIYTHGDEIYIVTDDNGDEQAVRFSRKTDKYAWMVVTYTLNDEETFLGEEALQEAVVEFGDDMDNGEDYEPTKFYQPLYSAGGIYVSRIEIAVTDDEEDVPTYQSTRISISDTDILNFSEDRITVQTS